MSNSNAPKVDPYGSIGDPSTLPKCKTIKKIVTEQVDEELTYNSDTNPALNCDPDTECWANDPDAERGVGRCANMDTETIVVEGNRYNLIVDEKLISIFIASFLK